MTTLHDLILDRFKVKTRAVENPVTDTVGTEPVIILHNNPNRVFWLLINLSPNTIYVALSHDVSPNKGVYVDPNGGGTSMIWDEDFHATGWAVWAVASAADSKIYVLEIATVG